MNPWEEYAQTTGPWDDFAPKGSPATVPGVGGKEFTPDLAGLAKSDPMAMLTGPRVKGLPELKPSSPSFESKLPEPSKVDLGGKGAALAGLGGFVDNLAMGLPASTYGPAAISYLVGNATGSPTSFKSALENSRAVQKMAKDQNLGADIAGNVAGVGASLLTPGGVLGVGEKLAAKVAPTAVSKFPTLAKMLGTATDAAALGGASGALNSVGTGEDVADEAKRDAILGGAFGGLAGGAGKALTAGGKGLASLIAFKDPALVGKYYDRIGKFAPGLSKEKAGAEIGDVLSDVEYGRNTLGADVMKGLEESQIKIKRKALADAVTREFDAAKAAAGYAPKKVQIENAKQGLLEGLAGYNALGEGSKVVRPDEAHQFLQSVRELANFDPNARNSLLEKAAKGASHAISEGTEAAPGLKNFPGLEFYKEAMGKQMENINSLKNVGIGRITDPKTGLSEYKPRDIENLMKGVAKEDTGKTKALADVYAAAGRDPQEGVGLVRDAYLKDLFERPTSSGSRNTVLGTAVGGALGSFTGMPLLGAGLGAGVGWAQDKYGGQVAKTGLNLMKNIEGKWGSIPESSQRVLRLAAARGPAELMATHTELLKKDPAYRSALEKSNISRP